MGTHRFETETTYYRLITGGYFRDELIGYLVSLEGFDVIITAMFSLTVETTKSDSTKIKRYGRTRLNWEIVLLEGTLVVSGIADVHFADIGH